MEIRVGGNGRHFVDEKGDPVFWLGDTQWELFRLYRPDTARRILRARQAQGFNVMLIMLTGVNTGLVGGEKAVPYANLDGEVPWIDGDPAKPNEKYFEHIDSMIRLGAETGQTFVVGIYHQWHVEIITVEKARAWARWISGRYRDVPGLIWCMYPKATEEYVPVCRELAAGLAEGDEGRHLISVHPDPSVASSSFIHEEEWLPFNMIQVCMDYDRIHETVTADYQRTPVKPVVMAEGAYEGLEFGKFQTAHHIRKQAYWSQLAGGYHVYGHSDEWRVPDEYERWLADPGAEHMRIFREVFTSCPRWWEMAPDQSILAAGAGEGYALNMAARAAAGDWVLAYLSEPSTVTIRAGAVSSGPRAEAWWIDPTTGKRTPAGEFPAGEAREFICPAGWSDAVLYLRAAAGVD